MKTIQVPARLPEKQDIIQSWDILTNEEIQRFVCNFEGLDDIAEFHTKVIPTKRFGDVKQLQMVRADNSWSEFYSGKTCAVYRISYIDDIMFFEEIFFKGNRSDDVGYGLDPDTANAISYCIQCNTVISVLVNWLGNHTAECPCQSEKRICKMKKERKW
jgi:hypothetical protein